MPAPAYTLPPFAEPRIALSRTPSPVPDAPDALISGVELIVSQLPRNGITFGPYSENTTCTTPPTPWFPSALLPETNGIP
jgi:hypothetical protein